MAAARFHRALKVEVAWAVLQPPAGQVGEKNEASHRDTTLKLQACDRPPQRLNSIPDNKKRIHCKG